MVFCLKALTPCQSRYACIERECLAICFGCEKFDQFLAGRHDPVVVETDHKPLEIIFKKSLISAPKRLQRMLLKLQRYNLDVRYVKVSKMYISDMLSRMNLPAVNAKLEPCDVFFSQLDSMTLNSVAPKFTDHTLINLQRETSLDPQLQTLKTTVISGWPDSRNEVNPSIHPFWNFRGHYCPQWCFV